MSTEPPTPHPQPSTTTATATRPKSLQKRQSILPRPASLAIDPTVIIAQHASLAGNREIVLGANCVLHPHCRVSSTNAGVVLGEGVVVFEKAGVGVQGGGGGIGQGGEEVRLGRNVTVETGAVVEGVVGEGSVVEVGARVGVGCVVGKFCTITSMSVVPPGTKIPDFTVVYAGFEQRIDETLKKRKDLQENRRVMHEKQIEIFRKLVANNAAKWM